MGLFYFVKKPTQNTQNEIKRVNVMPNIVTIQNEENSKIVFDIKVEKRFIHRDGSKSCLVSAKVAEGRDGDAIIFSNGKPICFEVPDGRTDLVKEILENNKTVQLNDMSYSYIGRAKSEENISSQMPSQAIITEIEKLNQKLLEETERKRIDSQRKQAEIKQRESKEQQELLQRLEMRKQKENRERKTVIENPFLKGGIGRDKIEEYDGVNLSNGEYLRVRGVKKVGKDLAGTYLYTARLNSVTDQSAAERLDISEGIPVAFSLPYRLNDIVNSKYDDSYKSQLIQGILQMLSNGYEGHLTKGGQWDESRLHDIGGIDKNGKHIENTRDKVSSGITEKIRALQQEYVRNNKEEKER